MTEAMNFFQSLFSLNNFAPATAANDANIHERRLGNALIADAKALRVEAEKETQCGEQARELMLEARFSGALRQNMAMIARWHYGRAFEKYQKAAARYDEAARIPTKKSRLLRDKVEATAKRAREIEATIESLSNFSK